MPREKEVVLSEDTARRMMGAIRWVEGRMGRDAPGSRVHVQSAHWFAKVTTTITAGNMTATPPTLGQGLVTLLEIVPEASGTPASLKPIPGQDGVVVYHGGSAAIAAGRIVQVTFKSGGLAVDVDYCT